MGIRIKHKIRAYFCSQLRHVAVGKRMPLPGCDLQAYTSLGITSCHEPTTAEETLERLRLGMYVLIREGEIRRELEEIAKIKELAIK